MEAEDYSLVPNRALFDNPEYQYFVEVDGHLVQVNPEELLSAPGNDQIRLVLEQLFWFLLFKNRRYGNAALDPLRVFSRAGPIERINDRIDDKLQRIRDGQGLELEDVERDLIGYFVLKRVARAIAATNLLPAEDPK